MELLQYAAHTPAFTASLAQSALPGAPVIEEETAPPRRSWAHSSRAAVSTALHRIAEAIAPAGLPDSVAPARQMG